MIDWTASACQHRRMLRCLTICYGLVAAAPAPGCETALLLAMDVSNSVDTAEYRLQTNGLALALADPDIAKIMIDGQVAVAVMQWAGTERQQLSIDWTRIGDGRALRQLAARASAMERAFVLSDTAPGAALDAAIAQFDRAPDCLRMIIDVSGDGAPNAGPGTEAPRQRAQRAGITINGLAIEAQGHGLAITNFYRRRLITRDGFVMTARGFESFAETLRRKILREISRVTG